MSLIHDAWNNYTHSKLSDNVKSSTTHVISLFCFSFAGSADTRLRFRREAPAIIYSDGTILWIPMAILKSTCDIDLTHFPFDEQTCSLKFYSWTYNGDEVDLDFFDNRGEVDITNYISSEWEIVSHPAVKNTIQYPCCNEPYHDLIFGWSVLLCSISTFWYCRAYFSRS